MVPQKKQAETHKAQAPAVVEPDPMEPTPAHIARRLRNWRERFDKDVVYIWTRNVNLSGKHSPAGSVVEKRAFSETKLRRLFNSGWIKEKDWLANYKARLAKRHKAATPQPAQTT